MGGLLSWLHALAKCAQAAGQEAYDVTFHRATPLSWSVPGPEALRPSITAGLPLFG
jgi:hypothetical protein